LLYSTDIVLYHYTDEQSASAIKYSGLIYQSSGGGDAAFGKGVYLTSIGMGTPAEVVAANNWDDDLLPEMMIQAGRTDYAIKVTIKRNKVIKKRTKSGRDIYLYQGNLNLNGGDVTYWTVVSRY